MTRTSAIFGVVSVLTAAIVGGVFIRKKIIDDALYWRAWVEAEGRWKREIRELEGEIGELNLNVKINNKSTEDTSRKIERYKREIEESVKDIKELEEKMDSSKHYSIPKHVVKIVNKNFYKQNDLKEKIRKFNSEINEFNENISDEETNSEDKVNELKQKIEKFSEILGIKKEKLEIYADRRIKLSKKFKQYKAKKEETEKQQKDLKEKLSENKNLLDILGNLIKELEVSLKEKTLQLSNLRKQGPIVVI